MRRWLVWTVAAGVALLVIVYSLARSPAAPPYKFLNEWTAVPVEDQRKIRPARDDDGIRAYVIRANHDAVVSRVSAELDAQGLRLQSTSDISVFVDAGTGAPRVKLFRNTKASSLFLIRYGTEFVDAKMEDTTDVGWVTAVVYVPSQPTPWESFRRWLGF